MAKVEVIRRPRRRPGRKRAVIPARGVLIPEHLAKEREAELFKKFTEEFGQLEGKQVNVTISAIDAWAVMCAVQLATRHPSFTGPTRVIAERFARGLADALCLTETLRTVVDRGWDPDYDLEKDD